MKLNMSEPLASCVCVTFDRPTLLNELLYCFLAQDYENKELIIINDQGNIKYVYKHPKIRIYNLPYRFTSLGRKREYSRTLTNGDFIFIMDDDDIYYSNHISRLISFHQNHPEFDIVANKLRDYTESNENFQTLENWTLPLNGGSVTKEYWNKTAFPLEKSCGEDNQYVKTAKIHHIDDNQTSFHYRWGLDVFHISGAGDEFGIQSYSHVTRNTPNTGNKVIILNPGLSEKTKSYYK